MWSWEGMGTVGSVPWVTISGYGAGRVQELLTCFRLAPSDKLNEEGIKYSVFWMRLKEAK